MKHPILDQHWSLAATVGLLLFVLIASFFLDVLLVNHGPKTLKIGGALCVAGRCVE